MLQTFPFKELFLAEVAKRPGMVHCHAHLDRAYTLTPEIWEQASALMEEKWILNREIKKRHTRETLIERISYALDNFISQGMIGCRTHIDADSVVGMLAVNSAAEVREQYKDRFTLQLVAHPLEGFLNAEGTDFDKSKMDLYEEACTVTDAVGGLPSRDRALNGADRKHADFLFSIAKNLGKDMDVHIDQENNPYEKDTEWFLDKIEEHGMQGRVTLVHAISVAAQPEADRLRLYAKMKDLGVNVTVCPTAAISMKQHKEKVGPIHNSIAQVDEMVAAGVNVAIGIDNISDMFLPEVSGDLFHEVLVLASACRYYDIASLAKLVTDNGYKTMKINP